MADEVVNRTEDLLKSLLDLQENSPEDTATLEVIVRQAHPNELADVLGDLDGEFRDRIFELLDEETLAEILDETDEESRRDFVESADIEELGDILDAMPSDEGADFLDMVPEEHRERVLREIEDPEQAAFIRELSRYEEDTAGGLMTKDFVAVPASATAREAIRTIQETDYAENRLSPYIVDEAGVLIGVIEGVKLLASRPDTPVTRLIDDDIPLISVELACDKEEIVKTANHYNLNTVPVVDTSGALRGIVTYDDILDAASEEASEDMFRMAGTASAHPTTLPVFKRVTLRLPWVFVTMTGGILSALVLNRFSDFLQANAALYLFLPVIQAMGGSVGIQSSTIMVRGMATGEVTFGRLRKVFVGELGVGGTIAVICGAVMAAISFLFTERDSAWLAACVFMALFSGIVMSAMTGTAIPLICKKIGLDPAMMAGTFVTMLNDVVALSIYLVISNLVLLTLL